MANVAHSTLTGANLHEPKGVAAAAAGKVYITDGAGSGAFTLAPIVLLNKVTASTSSSLSFNNTYISSAYSKYRIELKNILPATHGAGLMLRFSTDNGSSYLATNYFSGTDGQSNGSGLQNFFSSTTGAYLSYNAATTDLGNGIHATSTYGGLTGSVTFCVESGNYKTALADTMYARANENSNIFAHVQTCSVNTTTAAANAVQLIFNTGNIISGTAALYGIKDS